MFLRNCDLISDSNCIYYNGYKQHVSRIGGFLTILAYLCTLFFAVYFSIDAVYKKNPTSYFFKKFIPDTGVLYLNSTMFHFIELLDPDDNVIMDERSWMIFGTETYIDKFLLDFDISEESHWNYGPCNDKDDREFKSQNEDLQYFKAWCTRGYWNASTREYITNEDENYIPPYIAHGTGSKVLKNIGYGVYIAKCQNTTFRNNCRTMKEINEEFKKLLRIKVSVIDNNFDVTLYKNPVVPYFLDIKNHLTGETITHNNLNFNPVAIQTNDGLVFNTNLTSNSYILDFNEKLTYERGNTILLSGWYFLITNLCETYTRTYPKIQESLANVGGALKAILLFAEIINFLFNQWRIILDIQYECEKLGLDYSFFDQDINLKGNFKNFQIQKFDSVTLKNEKKTTNNYKNASQIPLSTTNSSNMNKNLLGNKLKQINNYIDKKENINSKNNNMGNFNDNNVDYNIDTFNNKQNNNMNKIIKRKKGNIISFFLYIKSIFKAKIKDTDSNIRLMHKFWINKISEENIVHMDLKLYKLSHKYLKSGSSMHINNLIEDSQYKKRNSSDYETKKVLN